MASVESEAGVTENQTESAVSIAVISGDRLVCDAVLRLLNEVDDWSATGFSDRAVDAELRGLFRVAIVDARFDAALAVCRSLATTGSLSVVLIEAPAQEMWAIEALRAGARGILTMDARSEDLVRAVRAVEAGDVWARRTWLCSWLRRGAGETTAASTLASERARLETRLSRRERAVFHHAATGVSNREIARRLAISEATVKVHLTRIFRKLGLGGRGELAAAYHGVMNGQTPEPAASRAS